jgi:hypothetical protein
LLPLNGTSVSRGLGVLYGYWTLNKQVDDVNGGAS